MSTNLPSMRRENIYIYVNTAEDAENINEIFTEGSLIGDLKTGGIETAIEDAPNWSIVPSFLVIDIRGIENPIEALQDLANATSNPNAETNLIILGEDDSIGTYRYFVDDMGASDYIPMPAGAQEIFDSVQRIVEHKSPHELDRNRCITFVGIRGGVGTSSITAAMADIIVDQHERRCIVIDFDITTGAQSLIMQKDPSNGLTEMLKNPSRIDSIFLTRSLSEVRKNLFVLASNNPKERSNFDSESAQAIIRQCQEGIDIVLCDVPYHSAVDPSVVFNSETTFLCTYPTLLGLRDVIYFVNYLQETRYPGKIIILLCKTGERTGCEVPKEHFENSTNALVFEIPYDPKSPAQSIRDLEPLHTMSGKMPQALKIIAQQLPTHTGEEEPESFLDKLKAKFNS